MALPSLTGPASKSEAKNNRQKFLSTPGVQDKINAMAEKFGVSAEEILSVIEKETGGSYSPSQKNFGGGGARGLIQFLAPQGSDSKTILGKEYKISEIESMDVLTQLDLVDDYFTETLKNAGQDKFKEGEVGLAVALPSFVGKSEEWIKNYAKKNPKTWARFMKNNPGWTIGGEGTSMTGDSIRKFYFPDAKKIEINKGLEPGEKGYIPIDEEKPKGTVSVDEEAMRELNAPQDKDINTNVDEELRQEDMDNQIQQAENSGFFSEEELETLSQQEKLRKIKSQEEADIELKQEDMERQIERAENSGYFSEEEIEALLRTKNTTPALIQNEIEKREEANTVPTGKDVDEYMKTLGFNSEEIEEIKQSSQQKKNNFPGKDNSMTVDWLDEKGSIIENNQKPDSETEQKKNENNTQVKGSDKFNAMLQVKQAQELLNKYEETYPHGVEIKGSDKKTTRLSVGGGNDLYDYGLSKLSKANMSSLEENILAGSRAFYQRFGATGWEAFKQDDDANRGIYLDFMRDNGYLSYLDDNGNKVDLATLDYDSPEDAHNARGIIKHFSETVGNEKYAEFVTGESSGFGKFDSNFKNMLEDWNFTNTQVAGHLQIEKNIRVALQNEFKENEILQQYTPENPEEAKAWSNVIVYNGLRQSADSYKLEDGIDKYLADNQIDPRTNPDQSQGSAIQEIVKTVGPDPDAGKLYDSEGKEIPLKTDLSGLTTGQYDIEGLKAERKSILNDLESGSEDYSQEELNTMLNDVNSEIKKREEAYGKPEIDMGSYDPEMLRKIQETKGGSAPLGMNPATVDAILALDLNNLPDEQSVDLNEKVEIQEENVVGETDGVTTRGGKDDKPPPPKGWDKFKTWAGNNSGALLGGMAKTGMTYLAVAEGRKHIKEALKDIPIEEGHKLDGAWKGYMAKMREAAQSGMSAEQKYAAQNDLSTAYNLGIKNVARASGGNRAMFLANAGVLNANRVKGLLKLHAMDAKMQQDNLKALGTAVQYQNEHGRMTGEVDRRMAYNEEARKSALHGSLGNEYIKHALGEIAYATEKATNSAYMDAFMKLTEQQNINSGLLEEAKRNQARLDALEENYKAAYKTTEDAG